MQLSVESPYIQDFAHFEQHVAKLFIKAGWTVETAKINQPGYDLIVKKGKYFGAVQVKWLKNNVAAPMLLKFVDFLDSQEGQQFNCGFFITTKGFSGPARALIRSWGEDGKVFCGIAGGSKINFKPGPDDLEREPDPDPSEGDSLNPLGINKHGQVIRNTVEEIRKINNNAHLFVLVNNFKVSSYRRLQLLRETFLNAYQEISQSDNKFHCIDPEEVCIRASDQLYYWGIHILENPDNPRSELAFNLVGGRCYPRDDFINLADYIERKAGLGILRSE